MLSAVSILGSIGFMVSVFIVSLLCDVHLYLDWLSEAKPGILTGSSISDIVDYIVVPAVGNRHQRQKAKQVN